MRDLLISNQISLPSCLLWQQKFKGDNLILYPIKRILETEVRRP